MIGTTLDNAKAMKQHPRTCAPGFQLFAFWQALCLFFAFFFIGLPSFAQPMGAEQDMFTYRVQPNDTLSDLAELYTLNRNNWQVLQSLNQIEDPRRLPIGKTLNIPFSLIPVHPTTAALTHIQGRVLLNDQPATLQSSIQAGDRIQTGQNSFATVRLNDQSSLSIPENTQILFQQINEFQGTPIADVIFMLEEGTVETNADPEQRGVGRYEIHTPISITGVRGTKMRIRADAHTTRTELIDGRAHIQGSTLTPKMLNPRQGAALDTEGNVFITNLLEAPRIQESTRSPGHLQVSLTPVDGASHYIALIAADPDGQQIIGQQSSTEPNLSLAAVQAGTHYAFIRAVDANGFMGLDTMIDFPGHRVLLDRSGQPIRTRFGHVVLSGLP